MGLFDNLLKSKEEKLLESIISEMEMYRQRMEGYSHKDQKPYWTKE